VHRLMRSDADAPSRAVTAAVTMPADRGFLDVARSAVSAALAGSGGDEGCERDLQLATDELASILVVSARARSQLNLAVTDDGTDVYVRMSVPVGPSGFYAPSLDLTRMLLDATVDSYEVVVDGDDLIGILQRALVDDPPERPG
jgi:hypothetical protein